MKIKLLLSAITIITISPMSYANYNTCCQATPHHYVKPQIPNYNTYRQKRSYIGIAKGRLKSGSNEQDSKNIRLGYHITPNVAFEVEHGKTTEGIRKKYTSGSLVAQTRGPLYVKGQVGYTDIDFGSSVSKTGMNYGAGLGIQGRSGWGAELNYTHLPDNGNDSTSLVNFGVKYRF